MSNDEVTALRLGNVEDDLDKLKTAKHEAANQFQAIALSLNTIQYRLDSSDTMRGEMAADLKAIKSIVEQMDKRGIEDRAALKAVEKTTGTVVSACWVGFVAICGVVIKAVFDLVTKGL